ncbi:MAG: FG-GAP-like repeat-containing protein [Terriglobales bacterium]
MRSCRLVCSFLILISVVSCAILVIALPASQSLPATQKPELSFGKPQSFSAGGIDPATLAIGDLNGDGIPDLVVASDCISSEDCSSGSPGAVSVLIGNGDGTFQTPVNYAVTGYGATSVAIGDLNGDGHPDLLVGVFNVCDGYFGSCNAGVNVLLNNGNGTFQAAVPYTSNGYDDFSMAVADVNGDGKLDVVIGNLCSDSRNQCYPATADVLLGNGDGTFQSAVSYNTNLRIASMAVADVNGDGYPDIVATGACTGCTTNGGIAVLLNNGDGTFEAAVMYSSGGSDASSVTIGDVNGDGKPDVVVTNWCLTGKSCLTGVDIFVNNGDGTFQSPVAYRTGGVRNNSAVIADVNGDGIPDLVIGDWTRCSNCKTTESDIVVMVGNGDGTFQPAVHFAPGGDSVTWVAVGDLNGDGRPDLATINGNSLTVMLNSLLIKTTTVLTSSPNPATENQSVTFTATVSSSRAIPDGQTVTFSMGSTQLGTGKTLSGVATLNTSFSKVRSYGIKASYSGGGYFAASSATTKQVVSQSTSSTIVGSPSAHQPANVAGIPGLHPLNVNRTCGTSITLFSSGSPSFLTNDVIFNAQVNENEYCKGTYIRNCQGSVDFYDGSTLIGSPVVNSNCTVEVDTQNLTAGSHYIKAIYEPGSGWHSNSAHLSQVVQKWPTSTAITSSLNPSTYHQDVTFTATVTSTQQGPLPLTGRVRFFNGTKVLGAATLDDNGVATFTTKILPVGMNSITAIYRGDSINARDTSPPLSQTVN